MVEVGFQVPGKKYSKYICLQPIDFIMCTHRAYSVGMQVVHLQFLRN